MKPKRLVGRPSQYLRWCPYAGCSFNGTDAEVDEHRATGIHDDQPQEGSNLDSRRPS